MKFIIISLVLTGVLPISADPRPNVTCETSTYYEAPQNLAVCQHPNHTGNGFGGCERVEKTVCEDSDTGKEWTSVRRRQLWHCVSVGAPHDTVQQECFANDQN